MSDEAKNTVDVDPAADVALLEAAIAEGAAADAAELGGELGAPAPAPDPAAWIGAAQFTVKFLAERVAPNWDVTADEQRSVAGELAAVLAHYFPSGPGAGDHPLVKLAIAAGSVVAMRIDTKAGKLIPLQKPKPRASSSDGTHETTERLAPVPSGDDAQRQNAGGFTFGGGAPARAGVGPTS